MSIFRNDTLGSWTRGGQAIVHNVRMSTQVFFQTGLASLILWVMGTVWYVLEKSTDFERFVLVKLAEAAIKVDAAGGTNDPVRFHTPEGRQYWTSADWLIASSLARRVLHRFEIYLIHGAVIAGLFSLMALICAWLTFTRTGRGLGSNEYLRGARFGSAREVRRALWRQAKGPISIGGVQVPAAYEPEHILLCGAPGTGKTNLITHMLDGIRREGRRAIVYDTAGAFVEKFYRPNKDLLLNPLDARTDLWSPWVDVPRDYHYDQIAESTIPDRAGDPFWAKSARGTLVAVMRKLALQKHMLISVLLHRVLRSKLGDLATFVQGTDAAAFISKEGERTSAGIQAELASVMRSFSYLDDTTDGFSIRKWVENEDGDGWLFISVKADQLPSLRPLITVWLDIAISAIMSLTPDRDRRLYCVIDELPTLQKLPSLSDFLARARKYGGCGILGFQSYPQLEATYGIQDAAAITGYCSTWVALRANDTPTAKHVSENLGQVEQVEANEGMSYGVNDMRDGVNLSRMQVIAVNAPKSVSIMALVRGDARIVDAHEKAVGSAIAYIEEHAQLRRRDEGEIVHETTGRLIYARFTEHASRELDPHLHTHVVILNMTNRADGDPMASLETRAMYAEQMAAGQVYRNDLAHRLREIGYEIDFDPRRGLFEIVGVPDRLARDMSQRAEQIDAHAEEHGLSGQAARRVSFFETRGRKVKASLEQLRSQWEGRARSYEPELARLEAQVAERGERELAIDRSLAGRAALFGIRQSETREAVNPYGRMLRTALASHVGEVRLSDVRPLLDEHEARHKLLSTREQTGDQVLTRGRTSRRTARRELALAQHLALAVDDVRPVASGDRLLPLLETAGLTPHQEQALVRIATTRDRVTGVQGVGGAGKSTLVDILNKAAEPGTEMVALAPTSAAASNLGEMAGIPSRTVASLLAGGGHGITDHHVLVLDEAGQLGSRQAMRMLEISRATGARLILLGDDKQTGAIEQGKPFWLMQKLGMPTAYLTESMRQQTRSMKAAVNFARIGEYGASLDRLDRVVSGARADELAANLVAEWTRLRPETRATTNILVLENATRLLVNSQIRETLRSEGAIAAEDARLDVLTPSGMSDEEKHFARFYSGGQVVTFGRDIGVAGIARDSEYRVAGIGRDANGRQVVRLVGGNGRTIRWDPRLGQARHINVFNRDERELAEGDRIQWRLANKELDLKNAERGTVERLDGALATIRWDRGDRVQQVDLSQHKTWDHGYAETVYSAQSKTYARVYVLAPLGSGLVNGQNYYTAITRARFGVKLWTEDRAKLAEKLAANSGEKTSALEGLGRLGHDGRRRFSERHGDRLAVARAAQDRDRGQRRDRVLERELDRRSRDREGWGEHLAQGVAIVLDRFLRSVVKQGRRIAAERETTEIARVDVRERESAPPRGPER